MKEGDKVGASEATLLNMLNISPFTYGLVVLHVYDQGTVFSPKVLDITDEDLLKSFQMVGFYRFWLYLINIRIYSRFKSRELVKDRVALEKRQC